MTESHSTGTWHVLDDGAVRTLILERPTRANAYTVAMLDQLAQLLDEAEQTRAVRALVITGAGDRTFCAGADRAELAHRSWRDVLHLKSAAVFARLRSSRLVTIAAINGVAVGGGMELALACDLRVAVPHARFWLPEPAAGLLPAAGGTALLAATVGRTHARAVILGGAEWDADTAERVGFLTAVARDGTLREAVRAWTDRILDRHPDALQVAKLALLQEEPILDGPIHRLAQAVLVNRDPTGEVA